MYLIRRVFRCKPGTARRAAEQITKIGKAYENAGQRSPIRVYTSGGTVPGPANTVYMDWTAPVLESPYREGNPMPEEIRPVSQQMNEFVEESYIEFYEDVRTAIAGCAQHGLAVAADMKAIQSLRRTCFSPNPPKR